MPIRPRFPVRSKRDGLWKHWSLWVWFVLALALTLGPVILWKSGRWLVHEDKFDRVPWAVVLAGESRDCERTDAAINLFNAGRIDSLVISGCRIFKTHYQSEYMVDYAAAAGVPRSSIFEFRQDAYSTQEEARLLIRQFRLQNLDTVLIITSNYHTARTRRIFRHLAQGYPKILVYSAGWSTYNPSTWWANRESVKFWLNEWLKTIFTQFELMTSQPESGKADYQNLLPDIWNPNGPGAETDSAKLEPSLPAEPILPVPVDSTNSPSVAGLDTASDSTLAEIEEKPETPSEESLAPKLAKDSLVKPPVKPAEKKSIPKPETTNKKTAKKAVEKSKKK